MSGTIRYIIFITALGRVVSISASTSRPAAPTSQPIQSIFEKLLPDGSQILVTLGDGPDLDISSTSGGRALRVLKSKRCIFTILHPNAVESAQLDWSDFPDSEARKNPLTILDVQLEKDVVFVLLESRAGVTVMIFRPERIAIDLHSRASVAGLINHGQVAYNAKSLPLEIDEGSFRGRASDGNLTVWLGSKADRGMSVMFALGWRNGAPGFRLTKGVVLSLSPGPASH